MNFSDLNCILSLKAKQGDVVALEQLWEINQGLVQKIIRQYPTTKSVDTDDLLQCAWFSLLEAVQEFDPKRGSFATMLVWRIRQACLVALGRRRKHVEESISLDAPLVDDPDAMPLRETIADNTLKLADEMIQEKDMQRDILDTVNRLSEKERAVVLARYYNQMTLQQTAEFLSMPVIHVRQREAHALKVLRRNKVLCRWCCPDGLTFCL